MSDIPGRKVSDALAVNTKAVRELTRTMKDLVGRIDTMLTMIEQEQELERQEIEAQQAEANPAPRYL